MIFALKQFTSCPSGMEKTKIDNFEICLQVTSPKKWENSCLTYGATKSILDLSSDKVQSVVNHLKTVKKLPEFWLPAQRDSDYNPFQWKIAGNLWNEKVDIDDYELTIEDTYKDKCLKLVISAEKNKLKSDNCEVKIPEVCVFDETSVAQMACKKGLSSKYLHHQNKCFSIERTYDAKRTLYQATNIYSLQFVRDLMEAFNIEINDLCLVNLGTVDYSQNYFTNSSYGRFTVMDRNGRWKMSNSWSCVIYEETIELQTPEISLKFDSSNNRMLMIVYSDEYLMKDDDEDTGAKCFTIANNDLVKTAKIKNRLWSETIKKYEVKYLDSKKSREVSKTIFDIKLYGNGPGIYWCEGRAISSGQLIKSKKVVARKKLDSVVFAVQLESKVNLTSDAFYEKKFLKALTKQLRGILESSNNLTFYEKVVVSIIKDIRVMKIIQFDKLSSQLNAIYHVTILKAFDDSSSEEYEDFMSKYAEKFDDVKVVVSHQLMSFIESILTKAGKPQFNFLGINSTEYCLPDSINNPNPLTDLLVWDQAFVGETLPPTDLCIYQSGIPMTRKCEGDFLHGGKWETLTEEKLQCIDQEILSLHTKRLFAFNKVVSPNETHEIISNMTAISSHYDQLIAADLFYISKAVQLITSNVTQPQDINLNSTDLDDKYNLTIILNNIMNVNESLIQLSQLKLNTTNILLDSYENLINSLSTNYSIYSTINNNLISNSLNETDGTFIMKTEKIIVFICDPGRMNVSGMALIRNRNGDEESLMDYRVEKLYATQQIDDIWNIYQDTLEIASFFPDELLNRIDEIRLLEANATDANATEAIITEPLKIVIKVFYNDAIFKESSRVSSYKSQSKIISVSLPGHDNNLPLLLPIMFKKSNNSMQSDDDVCGYWEFQPNGTYSESSEWLQEGCEFLGVSKYDPSLVLCGCSHLTHFAYLIMGTFIHDVEQDGDVRITLLHKRVLNIITLLGSVLSILGILGIFVTAITFRAWREKASTKVLLQLSFAIALQMVIISFFSTENYTLTLDTPGEKLSCVALGTCLHYSVLVTFSWMLITAFLQFKRYVIVLGNLKPERFFLKSFFVGWGMPLIPIVTVLIIDPFLYIPEIYGICYPQGMAFYFSVLLPVGLISTLR